MVSPLGDGARGKAYGRSFPFRREADASSWAMGAIARVRRRTPNTAASGGPRQRDRVSLPHFLPFDPPAPRGMADLWPEPVRVLVVDDVPEICQIFQAVRRRIRFPVIEMRSETHPERALALVRQEAFDLVVSDFRMRGPDGAQILSAARARNPQGYRVLMTGYNELPTTIEHLRAAGVDVYLHKPFRSHDLLLLLLTFVRRDETTIEALRAASRIAELEGHENDRVRS